MSIFKCKMCGGTIEFEPGATVGVCDSCGTKQTLPRLDDDKRANLYDRANHFRRNNEFDKAAGIYEQILNEDNTDAEAYWSLVLCRYGIEYVEDPQTHKRVPTVNRAQFTSIYMDEDYKSALQYADGYQKTIYEEEAKAIDDIQKGILEISAKEEPFDVFICYKETDANGRRTQDSVLANDLYHQLTEEGFKVFFARITLEDKLGVAYEPYIFAALNSAKVMVAIGTKPEYFNAVWVKNEWSRYLALVKNSGGKKMLIPAYKDMDPYDLPEEFSHLQAQDMSKLGFMQDLIRGIKKIISADAPQAATVKETVIVGANSAATAPLLERVYLFLEDGKWKDANIYCEKVLDIDPKNAEAYLGKLMAELRVKNRKLLADCDEPFDDRDNFSKVIRFGDEKLEAEMRGYIAHINERNENARLAGIYDRAVNEMRSANTEEAFKKAASTFQTIPGYKDADTLAEQCLDKAEVHRKDAIYSVGKSKMRGETVAPYEEAIKLFSAVSGWKDVDAQIVACQKKIKEICAKEEAERLERERQAEIARREAERIAKRNKKIGVAVALVASAAILFAILYATLISPALKRSEANKMLAAGDYANAYAILQELGDDEVISESRYNRAVRYLDAGDMQSAYMLFDLANYKDSAQRASEALYIIQKDNLKNIAVGQIVKFGAYEQDNNANNGKEEIEWRVLAVKEQSALLISEYALDCVPYNNSYESITWENCTLRLWLNDTFYNKAFAQKQQEVIKTMAVSADKNPKYSTNPGNATTDKVFLLSIDEVNRYFGSDEARKCVPTAYAIANGAYTSDSETKGGAATCCWWWLRSPGDHQSYAAGVFSVGSVYYGGHRVHYDYDGVRPALWINLDS